MNWLSKLFGDPDPDPSDMDADDIEQLNRRWMEQHGRQRSTGPNVADGSLDVGQQEIEKAEAVDGVNYKSEFPWLYDPVRGVRWDHDPVALRTLAQENAWVQMLIQSISKEIAETSWTIVRDDDKRETQKRLSTTPEQRDPLSKDLPDATAERIFDFLQQPSPDHDWTSAIEMWVADYLEVGSATAVKAFPASDYGPDGQELVVDPETTKPRALQISAPEVWTKGYHDKTGLLTEYYQFEHRDNPGGGQRSTARGVSQVIEFDEAEVLWNDHSPKSNRRYGTPPTLLVCKYLKAIDLAITQEQDYLSSGAIPSGMLNFDDWDKQRMQEWKEENEDNIKGKPQKMLMFAGTNAEYTPFAYNFSEMQFTERQQFYSKILAAAFQVPTSVVGLQPEKVNYNTFQGERANFESNTLGPYLQDIERWLTEGLIKPHWGDYRFEFTPGMSESTRQMISERVRAEWNAGIRGRAEARKELGLADDLATGDEFKESTDAGDDGDGGLGDILQSTAKAEYEVGDETIDISPPEQMINTVEAAIDADERLDPDCGTGAGRDTAAAVLNDDLGPTGVDDMATYLTSHEEDVTADGPPTDWSDDDWRDCGNLQYALWGGVGDGSMKDWAQERSDAVAEARGEEPTYKLFTGGDSGNANLRKDEPLRNTDDWAMFDVQPDAVESLADDIADDVNALFEQVFEDGDIQAAIERFASEETEKSLGEIAREIQDFLSRSGLISDIGDAITDASRQEVFETIESAIDAEDDDPGIDPDAIAERVTDRDQSLAADFADRMSDEIRETVADGWEDGKNAIDIRDDLQETEQQFGDWQAERIARQELQVAAGQARNEYAAETGRVEVWQTSEDDRVREAHDQMNGRWKEPGEAFEVDYTVGDGPSRGVKQENVPGDSEPGIGCRCTTLLVDPEEVDDDNHAGV
jgi:hypothetical protein